MPKKTVVGSEQQMKEWLRGAFGVTAAKKEEVVKAVTEGKKVVIVESLCSDPGDDYCAVTVDGKEQIFIAGY